MVCYAGLKSYEISGLREVIAERARTGRPLFAVPSPLEHSVEQAQSVRSPATSPSTYSPSAGSAGWGYFVR